jgi:hypothetical protein
VRKTEQGIARGWRLGNIMWRRKVSKNVEYAPSARRDVSVSLNKDSSAELESGFTGETRGRRGSRWPRETIMEVPIDRYRVRKPLPSLDLLLLKWLAQEILRSGLATGQSRDVCGLGLPTPTTEGLANRRREAQRIGIELAKRKVGEFGSDLSEGWGTASGVGGVVQKQSTRTGRVARRGHRSRAGALGRLKERHGASGC